MSKEKQMALLRQCAILFAKNKTCNESSVFAWLRIVYGAHRLGYLYCGFADDGNIDLACIAYRIKHISEQESNEIPATEAGAILYVNSIASIAEDKFKLLRLMQWYMKNNLEINFIAYDYRNDNNLKLHKVRRSKSNGEVIKTKFSKST